MIDFVRFTFRGQARDELEKRVIGFTALPEKALERRRIQSSTQKVDIITGEVKEYPKVFFFQGLEIRITEKQALISNSLHQMFNLRRIGREINFNDFFYSQVCDTIDYLIKFIPEIRKANVTSLEFGFNLETENSAKKIISESVLMYKLKEPNRNKLYGSRGVLKLFSQTNYEIKLYDKARQNYKYNIPGPLLRFEVRHSGKELRNLGILSIESFKNKMLLRKVFLRLLRKYDDLLVVDNMNKKGINKNDLLELHKFTNPLYWNTINNRQTRKRHKAQFEKLLQAHQLLKTKDAVKALLKTKFLHLINN